MVEMVDMESGNAVEVDHDDHAVTDTEIMGPGRSV